MARTCLSFVLAVVALALAVLRFSIPTHPLSLAGTYTALAHLFIGGLLGNWLSSRHIGLLLLVIALTAVELVAFFHLR